MGVTRVVGEGMKQLDVMLAGLDDKVGKVGWFDGAKYDTGETIASVAATQELGNSAHYIPPRPFMRPTIAERQNEWRGTAEKGAREIVKGKSTTATLAEKIGLKAAGDIREKIASIWTPKLSDFTIQERRDRKVGKKTIGSLDKPLIDTGEMLNSLTNSVEDA